MKLKHLLCALLAVTVMSTSAIVVMADTEEKTETVSAQPSVKYTVNEDTIAGLLLENPRSFNENGTIEFEDGELIDLVLPKELDSVTLTTIHAKSFAGCPCIRTVVIPETITEINDNAFADCKFLETIYVFGHNENEMVLGDNWNGGANVVYFAAEPIQDQEEITEPEEVTEPADDENANEPNNESNEEQAEETTDEEEPIGPADQETSAVDDNNTVSDRKVDEPENTNAG